MCFLGLTDVLTALPPIAALQDFFQFVSSPGVDSTLRKRAEKFKAHLTKKFRWDFDADLEDCAPVVVVLPDGVTVD